MTSVTFVIPCHNVSSKSYIETCVNSIRGSNPTANIVVVDSDSPDRSYMDRIDVNIIIDKKNKNYDFGAYWQAFDIVQSDLYICTHDSTSWNKEIELTRFLASPMTPFFWFCGGASGDWAAYQRWAVELADKTCGYKANLDGTYLAYGIFTIRPDFVETLRKASFNKCLPTCKKEAMYAGELLWKVAMESNGLPLRENTYYGALPSGLDSNKSLYFNKFSGTIDIGRA